MSVAASEADTSVSDADAPSATQPQRVTTAAQPRRVVLSRVLSGISVEVVAFLVYFAYVFGNTIQAPAIYHKICRIYYAREDCHQVQKWEVELVVQQKSAEWSCFSALAYLLPSLLADAMLGAYGDRFGWKTPLVLGVAGVALTEFGFLLTLAESTATPYWTTLVFGAVFGCTGTIAIIPVACNAFLAESAGGDSSVLTIRAALFAAAQTAAAVGGAFAAAGLYGTISLPIAMDVELLLMLLALLFVLWRIPPRPHADTEESRRSFSIPAAFAITPLPDESSRHSSTLDQVTGFFGGMLQLLKESIRTVTRRRVGRRRSYLLLTVLVLVLNYTTNLQSTNSGIINSYVFRRMAADALDWESDDIGWWVGAGYLIQALGTVGGACLFKRLGLRETSLMLIGVASSGLRVLLIGLAQSDAMMHVANCAGVFAGIVQPAAVSFIAQLVSRREIGKALSLLGVGGDVALLLVSLAYAAVYRVSVQWQAGVVFFLMAFLHVAAASCLLWMHVRSCKDGIGIASGHRTLSRLGIAPSSVTRSISSCGDASARPDFAAKADGWAWPNRRQKRAANGKISIAEHAAAIERSRDLAGAPVWQSEEDLRAVRLDRALY